jgi:hypothetical protein
LIYRRPSLRRKHAPIDRFSEFVAKIDEYVNRTDARLERLEKADTELRIAMEAWQARLETMESNIADLIRALRNDHPNGSKQGE